MRTFFEQLKESNEPLYYFGWVCLLAAGICLGLSKLTAMQVMGANAWFKPFKFYLSTAVFVWSMAWYMQYLEPSRSITIYNWGLIALFTFEVVYITFQAARGQTSHFNVHTPLYARLYAAMGLAATGISLWTAYITIFFFISDLSALPPAYVWGIRLGLVLFVIFSLEGLAMGARLAHTVGGPDTGPGLPVLNWSTRFGDLRIAHFAGMHALQIVPLLAYYVLKDVKATIVFGIVYGLMVTWIFLEALQAKPLFRQLKNDSQEKVDYVE